MFHFITEIRVFAIDNSISYALSLNYHLVVVIDFKLGQSIDFTSIIKTGHVNIDFDITEFVLISTQDLAFLSFLNFPLYLIFNDSLAKHCLELIKEEHCH